MGVMNEAAVLGTELERVLPQVPTLFDRDNVFYAQVEKRPVEAISNRDMRIPLEISPGGYFGHYDPDGGDLGTGAGPAFDKAVLNTVHLKHAIQWTKKAEWATDDKRKAVLNTFRHLLATAMAEFRRHVDSLCMTGGDGVVGTITSVATAGGFDTYTMTTDGFGARLLRKGQKINVYNAALTTNRTSGGEVEIVAIDYPNKTIKVAAVTGSAATDKIVISGLTATPPVSLKGVPYHHREATSGSWLGFDLAATPEVRGNRVNAGGAGLSLALPRLAINRVGDRIGIDQRGKKFTAWMHPAQQAAYEELGFNIMQIFKNPKEEALDLYFSDNMRMAGAPVKVSYSWDRRRIDFVDLDVWGRAEMKSPGFYEVDGRRIFELRGTSGGVAAAMIFYIVASFNLFVTNPAATAYIDSLAVPSGY